MAAIDPTQLAGAAGVAMPGAGAGSVKATPVNGKSFADVMIDSLNEVNRLQTEADAGVQRLLAGETDNVAEVFAASNKAGIAFDLLMEVRNKLLEAYREIQQMRV